MVCMEVDKAIQTIKICFNKPKKKLVLSGHFQDQCKERDLDVAGILERCKNCKILGIVEQEDDLYKVWIKYTEDTDVIVAIKILSKDKIKLITIFPQKSERR